MQNWKYKKTWVNIQTTDPMAYHIAGANWVIIATLTWRKPARRSNNRYAAERRTNDFNNWLYQVAAIYKTRLNKMVYYRTTEYGSAGECHYHVLLGEFGLENQDYEMMSLVLTKLWKDRFGDRATTHIEPFNLERHSRGSGASYLFKRERNHNQPVNYDYSVTNPHLCKALYTSECYDKNDFASEKLMDFVETGIFKSAPPKSPQQQAMIQERIQRLFALESVEDQPENMDKILQEFSELDNKLDKRLGTTNHRIIKRVGGGPKERIQGESILNKDLRTDSFNYLHYDKSLMPCFATIGWAVKLTLCFRTPDKADSTPDARKARANDLMEILSILARNRRISPYQIACCLVEDFITPNECHIHCYIARHKVSGTGYYDDKYQYRISKDEMLAKEVIKYSRRYSYLYQDFNVTVCNNATLTLPSNLYPNDALIALASGKELPTEKLPDDDGMELPF
jgi:hypothetical protein